MSIEVWQDEFNGKEKLLAAIEAKVKSFTFQGAQLYRHLDNITVHYKSGHGDKRYGDKRYGVFIIPFVTQGQKILEVTFRQMYSSDFCGGKDYSTESWIHKKMTELSQIFGTDKINVGKLEGLSSGCDTCGHNGLYEMKFFVFNPKL